MATMSESIPRKTIKCSKSLPYLTKDLVHLTRVKARQFKRAKRLGTVHTWAKYTKARNKVTYALRAAKSEYFHKLSLSLHSPKEFWSLYHKLSPKHGRIPTSLKHNSHTATSSTQKADLLNSFFTSCFTKPNQSQPYVPVRHALNSPYLSEVSCTEEEVNHLLSTYKVNTASDPDGISGLMLRQTSQSISPAITALFNLSLQTSSVPEDWKISNVSPIFKSGDPSSASNYRPISLLSLVSKALEKIIHHRVMNCLSHHHLLSNCQFGFRPCRSTQEALLSVTNNWHQSLSHRHQVAAVFFDIRKAFDSVPHDHLLRAIADVGISGPLFDWFHDYLTGRKQRVVLDGLSSSLSPVSSGVPQGSILGPLLFIIFMNSLSDVPLSPGSKLIMYADDILLYKPVRCPEDSADLQADVDSILSWINSHGMSPNHSKTKLLVLSRSKHPLKFDLFVKGHLIPPSPFVRYLGVTLSADLSWSKHIQSVCKSAKHHLGLIHHQLHKVPSKVRHQIYRSCIIPKLDYCCAVWDPHLQKDKHALDNVQKFAGRVVTQMWCRDLSSLQSDLNWQPLELRRCMIKLKVCFNIINNLSCIPPTTFRPHPSPSPRYPHTRIFSRPFASTSSYLSSFFISVIPFWNYLPAVIVNSTSSSSFKKRLSSFY